MYESGVPRLSRFLGKSGGSSQNFGFQRSRPRFTGPWFPPLQRTQGWGTRQDEKRDPSGKYTVDFRINHMKRPLFIYGIPGEDKMRDATINLLTFEKWGLKFQSLGVFEDQMSLPRKPLARFTDVVGKTLSDFEQDNRERLGSLLDEVLQEAQP
jgi:hypothetical protein